MNVNRTMFKDKGSQKMAETVNVESVIGTGLAVNGDIHSRGTLRVDGNVEGKISADGSVIIGEKGVVKANITADHIIVGGTVRGKVMGREKVEVVSKGRLYGDVQTKPGRLVVSEGGIFEGLCTMNQAEGSKQTSSEGKATHQR
ncbi:MAG: polymer-forming cytoskeletal protein [Candidatus Hydrogenedentota bacterium]|nr:MAG: polymer-forming cytoskeletal protein [Candidatus Hydrogenedentota bacterium]